MPNLTTPIPPPLSGNTGEDIKSIRKWGAALIDELVYIFNHLDAGNVSEAASVKAENIDTTNAKIMNAQIGNLTADKLRAGQVNTNLVKVESSGSNLSISGSAIVISDSEHERFRAEYDPQLDLFNFVLYNGGGEPAVYINSLGNAVFSGRIDSSEIFASTVVGADSLSYASLSGGVFAMMDKMGIKIFQDDSGERLQKMGMSVGDDGTAYMVLGAGSGEGEVTVNGVKYSDESFVIQKNDAYASLGIVGSDALLSFMNGGELWLRGKVLINGRDVLGEIDALKSALSSQSE